MGSEILGESLGRLVAVDGPLGHRLEADSLQVVGDGVVDPAGWASLEPHDLFQQRLPGVAVERTLAGQEFVKDDAEAEDVGSAVDEVTFASGLFRAHVGGRPGEPRASAEVPVAQRHPEIGEHGLPTVSIRMLAA